jgi:hypothetical protein
MVDAFAKLSYLVNLTQLPLAECRAALQKHGFNDQEALAYLLRRGGKK